MVAELLNDSGALKSTVVLGGVVGCAKCYFLVSFKHFDSIKGLLDARVWMLTGVFENEVRSSCKEVGLFVKPVFITNKVYDDLVTFPQTVYLRDWGMVIDGFEAACEHIPKFFADDGCNPT